MSWYDGIRRFLPIVRHKVLDGTPVRMELDVMGLGCSSKTHYPKDFDYVKLVEETFTLSNVVGKMAKYFSAAQFTDENENSKLLDKLNNPNAGQSKEEFLKEFAIYLFASGYTMVWIKWQSYPNFETMELININPDPCVTDIRKTTIQTEINGKKEIAEIKDVVFFYDVKKNHNDLKGYSRIKPLRSQVENIQDAQKAKNIQIANSGITIVSPKASPTNNIDEGLNTPITTPIVSGDGKVMKTQKDDMEEKLNTRTVSNRIIVANKGVDAVNLSAQLSGMDFYKIVEPDLLAIYDAFGLPVELSPYGKNNTYDNKKVAESTVYENEIIPLAQSFVNSFNSVFVDKGTVEVNYNHVTSVADTNNKVHDTNSKIAQTYRELAEAGIISNERAAEILAENGVL